jgi:hypothetical protein
LNIGFKYSAGKKHLFLLIRTLGHDILRFFLYFALVFAFLCAVYGALGDWRQILSSLLTERVELPNTFFTVLICSLLFIVFTILVSAVAVVRGQNHFKTSFPIRIFLFAMNIIPIALFQHYFFRKLGFRIIYFFPVYLCIQAVLDFGFSFLYRKIKKGGRWLPELGNQALAIFLTLVLINFPGVYKSLSLQQFNPRNIFEFIVYFLYIVLFNSVSFFTVEYCIDSFNQEYKKNYAKYYFMYNRNILKRVWYVLRNALPQALGKIRNNLTWLVMFIIPVETILENVSSLGSNILDSYEYNDGPLNMIRNIKYLLIIMFIINAVIDGMIALLKINVEEPEVKTVEKQKSRAPGEFNDEKLYPGRKSPVLKIAVPLGLVILAAAFIFNQQEYAFAGYYDFSENSKRTINDLFERENIKPDRCPVELADQYRNVPLFEKVEGTNYYSLVQIDIQTDEGETLSLIPYYDVSEGGQYYYIQGRENLRKIRGISSSDRIVAMRTIEKYRPIAFTGIMTAYKLQANTDKNIFAGKPLYLALPFYVFYFLTLLFITAGFTYCVYFLIVKYHLLQENSLLKNILKNAGRCFGEVLSFLNALTLIIVFLLVNLVLQNNVEIAWENKSFAASFISYALIQFIIIAMFSTTYTSEISLHVKRILASNEFGYYSFIGMGGRNKFMIYNAKYGRILLLKLLFQNILFVFNINWFICYAFNIWNQMFNDSIGVTYSISLENIFTKIIAFESVNTGIYNFIILALINIALFTGYYFYQRKISSE